MILCRFALHGTLLGAKLGSCGWEVSSSDASPCKGGMRFKGSPRARARRRVAVMVSRPLNCQSVRRTGPSRELEPILQIELLKTRCMLNCIALHPVHHVGRRRAGFTISKGARVIGSRAEVREFDTAFCEPSLLLGKPLPRNPAAETALQPLIPLPKHNLTQ